MLEIEAKNRAKPHYKNQIRTSLVQKIHPTSSLAQGASVTALLLPHIE
ncbi:hypothetical protein [Collimonas sp. OK607]|nr:hypothetical protein [Collimonas sp. OK607]